MSALCEIKSRGCVIQAPASHRELASIFKLCHLTCTMHSAVELLCSGFTLLPLKFLTSTEVVSQVDDIHQADACKITPAKFSGSKEVVPLHFRKVGTSSPDFLHFAAYLLFCK